LVIGSRSISIHNEQRNALSVLNTLLSGGMSSRLNMNIREKYGYCYSIYSFVNMFEDTGDFGVYMGTDERKIDRSKTLILNELSKVVESPISPKTLAQIKQQIKAGMMLEMESTSNRMMRLGKTELYFREYYTLDEIAESIDAVTANEVQTMAAELFAPANMSSVVYLPKE
jgi:predicted Zn-dependent peptidase